MHLQYVPFWALLGLAIMVAGCAVFSIAVSPHALSCSLLDPDQGMLCIKRMIPQTVKPVSSGADCCNDGRYITLQDSCHAYSALGKQRQFSALSCNQVAECPFMDSKNSCGRLCGASAGSSIHLMRCMAVQSLSAGKALKQLVTLVGGSSSGFNGVIAAYVTTFTVTIVVSAICLGLAFAMYGMRTDQKLRRDLRYGGRV